MYSLKAFTKLDALSFTVIITLGTIRYQLCTLLICSAIYNIAVACEITASIEIHNFVIVTLQKYFVTLICYYFYYCNLLRFQVTEKSNL